MINLILHLEAVLVVCGVSDGAAEASVLRLPLRPLPLRQNFGHQSVLAARQLEGFEG